MCIILMVRYVSILLPRIGIRARGVVMRNTHSLALCFVWRTMDVEMIFRPSEPVLASWYFRLTQ